MKAIKIRVVLVAVAIVVGMLVAVAGARRRGENSTF
jgi:hypothetical protein